MTTDRNIAGKGFAIPGVPCFADNLVQGGNDLIAEIYLKGSYVLRGSIDAT